MDESLVTILNAPVPDSPISAVMAGAALPRRVESISPSASSPCGSPTKQRCRTTAYLQTQFTSEQMYVVGVRVVHKYHTELKPLLYASSVRAASCAMIMRALEANALYKTTNARRPYFSCYALNTQTSRIIAMPVRKEVPNPSVFAEDAPRVSFTRPAPRLVHISGRYFDECDLWSFWPTSAIEAAHYKLEDQRYLVRAHATVRCYKWEDYYDFWNLAHGRAYTHIEHPQFQGISLLAEARMLHDQNPAMFVEYLRNIVSEMDAREIPRYFLLSLFLGCDADHSAAEKHIIDVMHGAML